MCVSASRAASYHHHRVHVCQVSTMSLFEYYRMNIPLFAPSLSLLKVWCDRYDLMWERSYGWPVRHRELIAEGFGEVRE